MSRYLLKKNYFGNTTFENSLENFMKISNNLSNFSLKEICSYLDMIIKDQSLFRCFEK